jgi:hypothetical protein
MKASHRRICAPGRRFDPLQTFIAGAFLSVYREIVLIGAFIVG